MIVTRLELVDYRNYVTAAFELTAGTTAVVGQNGQGKTNFAEALGYWVEVVKQRATLDPGDPLKNWLIYVLEI